MNLNLLSLDDLARGLAAEDFTAVALAEACLARVKATDDRVGAFLSLDREGVLAQARAADGRRAAGAALGPLDGVPVALKDVIAVQDAPLTCGSRMLASFVSPYDATVTVRLKAAGAVLFGRLNMDEFAMGSSTENSAFQVTSNPWDLARIPGGSSGGSAAAVAAAQVPVSLGSDTGGSVRQPAALCGVVGLKPTYGLVSRYGLVAYASSLDQIGPLGRSVADVATLLQVIAGHDERDSTSAMAEIPNFPAALTEQRTGRIGVPREYFGEGLDPEVREAVDAAIAWYRNHGYEIVELSLPRTDLAIPVYYVIATAEASSNLSRYDGVRYGHRAEGAADGIELYFKSRAEGFGDEVKRRIMLGTYVLSSGYYDAYYKRAQQVRTLMRNDFLRAFEKVDAVLTPTSPTTAFRRGEKADDPLAMYLSDIYTISANLAGIPGLSLPCGFSRAGLPVGLQLLGRPFGEAELLRFAHHYEQAHDWNRVPEL